MTPPVPKRRWIWYFVVLGLLAITGLTIPIVYNLRQQLKREDLEVAMARWAEHGPKSYNFRYVVKKSNSEPEEFHAEVRSGRVRAAYRNGELLRPTLWEYHDMPGRFRDIKGFLDKDAQSGSRRIFTVAQFSPNDGGLKRYVRSVMGTRERVEIEVKEYLPLTD